MARTCMRLGNYSLSVLPPRGGLIPAAFTSVVSAPREYEKRIADVQRFRGAVYLADGAVPATALDEDGRHRAAADYDSWQLVVTNRRGEVGGCMRVRLSGSPVDVNEWHVGQVLARLPGRVRDRYTRAVTTLRDDAHGSNMLFGEVGGWAVTEELRNGSAAVTLAAAVWPLCRMLGGTIAVAAATGRHNSARILERLGGMNLAVDGVALDPFVDGYFRCKMRILGFDSRRLSPRYEKLAQAIGVHLAASTLVTPAPLVPMLAVPTSGASRSPSRAKQSPARKAGSRTGEHHTAARGS